MKKNTTEDSYLFQIRVTGVLIEDDKILLVKQKVSSQRSWSLPGGRLEQGESMEEGMIREIKEETGLTTGVSKLLYICEKTEAHPSLIHVTFLLEKKEGSITLPTNEYDDNPIFDVKMVPIDDLEEYGFSTKFKEIVKNNFPNQGSYMGSKSSIGL